MPSQLTYKTTSFSTQNRLENTHVFNPDSSGKEKDSETGYYYFGARYYNSDLSLWLSVDPMADKYPSLSPYNYCAWNPMKIVDPDGNDGRVVVNHSGERTSIVISTTVYLKSDVLKKSKLVDYVQHAKYEADRFLKPQFFEQYNCEVSFDVQYKVYNGENLQPGDNLLTVNPNITSRRSGVNGTQESVYGLVVGGLAGNNGEINSDICNALGASKGKGILHETLHFLGLLDRYSGDKGFDGFEKDIMGIDARNATKFDDSHYLPYIEKYKNSDMSGKPYILLKDRLDVRETERLKRMNGID